MKKQMCKYCGSDLHPSFKCFQAPKKAIKKKSKTREFEDRIYEALNMGFRVTHTKCEAKLTGCTGRPDHVHHKYSGSSRSKYYLDTTTWMIVCNECHHLIHDVMSKEECYTLDLKRTY